MSSWVLHQNEDCFPNPTKFNPKQWLSAGSNQAKRMEKAFFLFSKGTRRCVRILYVFFPFLCVSSHGLVPSSVLSSSQLIPLYLQTGLLLDGGMRIDWLFYSLCRLY